MLRSAVQRTRGRLALLVVTVAAVMLSTAALLHFVFDQFEDYGEALWSALRHLLDPGSLGEDEGAAERTIGALQVVTGLVLLVGLFFELVTESVGRSIERLGRYDPPVRARGHLLILGGGEMLTEAAAALALAAEVGERRERVVLVSPEEARPERRRILRQLREQAGPARIDLVFGAVAEPSGFDLGAAASAAAILVLPSTSGPVIAEAADVEVMRTGLALEEYLAERGASPDVRLLFRRGRDVDAVWDMFPDRWDAVVGDRIVASVVGRAIAGLDQLPEIRELVEAHGSGEVGLLAAARRRAAAEGRPRRVTIVGCGINTPALLEDLAHSGAERFELTLLASDDAFEAFLGRAQRGGIEVRFEAVSAADPEQLREALRRAAPDLVAVVPSPLSRDLRVADAEATLTVLHTLRALGPETPVIAEFFLPETADRLPGDPRLLPVSGLEAVAGALALSVFNPDRAGGLARRLGVG